MNLADKKDDVPTKDRNQLSAVAAAGATPGQKLIGISTAVLAAVAIIGTVGYKIVYPAVAGEQVEAPKTAANAAPAATATAEPQLSVPMGLGLGASGEQASFDQGEPAAPGGMPGDRPLPPGLIGSAQPISYSGGGVGGNSEYGNSAAVGSNIGQPGAQAQPDPDYTAAQKRKMEGGFGSIGGESESVATLAPAAAAPVGARGYSAGGTFAQGPQPEPGRTALGSQLTPTSTPNTQAGRIANQHLTLKKGTPISCNLDTAIRTDQVGFVSCVLDFPVKSMDGSVVLMEAGTTVSGEYQKGITRGAKAIFVLWTEAITPMGVVVPLNSPGTDTLGRAGLDGKVDNKFWQRFSGAFLFSILQDGTAIAAQRAANSSSGGSVVVMPNTQSAGENIAGEVLKQDAEVQPTMTKEHGEAVSITVARHVDFSTVYKLTLQAPR